VESQVHSQQIYPLRGSARALLPVPRRAFLVNWLRKPVVPAVFGDVIALHGRIGLLSECGHPLCAI
jgi:hypothetical protein